MEMEAKVFVLSTDGEDTAVGDHPKVVIRAKSGSRYLELVLLDGTVLEVDGMDLKTAVDRLVLL